MDGLRNVGTARSKSRMHELSILETLLLNMCIPVRLTMGEEFRELSLVGFLALELEFAADR